MKILCHIPVLIKHVLPMLYIPERPESILILDNVDEKATPSLILKLFGIFLYIDYYI
jgi:hypothetical protein